jgi:hypothetical protein
MSAMVTSSVSPERWDTITPPSGTERTLRGLNGFRNGSDLVDLEKESVASLGFDSLLDEFGVVIAGSSLTI